ncbi:MAG: hypothetical protein ACREDS_14460 [Limisphaerales bacterium]
MISNFPSSNDASLWTKEAIFGFLAAIGGLVLFCGLILEWKSDKKHEAEEKKSFSDINEYRKGRRKSKRGEIWVISGVVIEIVIAVIFAMLDVKAKHNINIENAKNAPLNQPLSDLEVEAFICFSPCFITTSNFQQTGFNLLEKDEGIQTTNLERFRNLYPYEVQQFAIPGKNENETKEYPALHFRFTMDFINTFSLPPAHLTPKDILDNYPLIRIVVEGVPTNAFLVGGFARILINGTFSKKWIIPPQKSDMRFAVTNNWSFTLLATNTNTTATP